MSELHITGRTRLAGVARPPPDKSIAHRALILAALGTGTTRIAPLPSGEDNRATARALAALGVPIRLDEHDGYVEVEGIGDPVNLRATTDPIDCGNSGTTMRLLAGVLAATPFCTTLVGDRSLSSRPMSRLRPLEAMRARLTGVLVGKDLFPPLTIEGPPRLKGANHDLPIASAQVKSALLLAGLFAEGTTTVREPARSRDHTERMIRHAKEHLLEERPDGTLVVSGRAAPWVNRPDHFVVPDFSSAAFLLAAAILTDSPNVIVETGVNRTRTGFLDVVAAMGITVGAQSLGERDGEPVARLQVAGGALAGTVVTGKTTLRAIDELPILAALAAFASGATRFEDAAELRVKESDRLASTARLLTAFGGEVQQTEDGLVIEGGRALHRAEVDAASDHRIALTAAIMALAVEGTTVIHGAEVIDVSFPGFVDVLSNLGATLDVRH